MKPVTIKSAAVTVIIALLTLTSCNKLFDDGPYNKISVEKVWTNSMLLDEYVNGWYRNMNHGFKTLVPTHAMLKGISRYYLPWFGDQLSVGNTDWFNAGYGDILKANESSVTLWARNTWSSHYNQIQYINTYLENSEQVIDPEQKKRIDGEAHFMRAYYYYMLWRSYGGVFIIDHTFDPLKKDEKFPRASYDRMVEFIVDEANKAAALLPTEYEATNVGRATKGAALMLIAKTYLWASSPVFQNQKKAYLGFTDDKSEAMLAQAKEAYEALFALEKYDLIPISATTQDGIKNEYRKIFLTKNSQESIFEIQHSDDGDYANKFGHKLDRDAASPFFTGTTAAYTPTHNHVMEYGMRDGMTYDEKNPYENRDYRFYANVLYHGAVFRNHVMDIATTDGVAGEDITKYGTSTSAAVSRTGYYLGKFVDEGTTIDNNDTFASSQNYIIWRYAEALLDYAEVMYRLGKHTTALEYINEIRQRVHMDPHTDITWEKIVNERRIEMAFEETTYWDFFRWGTAVEKLNGQSNPLKMLTITIENGDTTYTEGNLNGRFPGRVRVFQKKQYYLPIPWADIKYHGVEQNPDWTEV